MLLREAALVLTQGNGGGPYMTCVEFTFLVAPANAFSLNPGTGVLKGKSMRLEYSRKGARMFAISRAISQREPEFFSAYYFSRAFPLRKKSKKTGRAGTIPRP